MPVKIAMLNWLYLIEIINLPRDDLPPYVAFFVTDFNEPTCNRVIFSSAGTPQPVVSD